MKFLVCVSKTPDTTAKIQFKDDNTVFDENGIQFIMNPYDEWYALVRALELKEALGGEVVILNVGSSSNDVVIRKGLAIGADRAVRIDGDPVSSFYTAKQIINYASQNAFDMIFLGKETISYNGSEVGAMVAEGLGLPYISYVSKMDFDGTNAVCERDVEGGEEVIELAAPFVVSAAKGMAEQRIPNMRGIMTSKRKALDVVPPVEVSELTETVSYDLPIAKQGVKMVDPEDIDELVRLLHEEAKVI